ncbi:MAG: hypothetical protein WD273_09935 [Trueperaceae bacterium]
MLKRALLRPGPLLALLVVLASAFFLLNSGSDGRSAPAQIEIRQPEQQNLETREVRLVRFDANGLESPSFAQVALPQAPGARLQAILGALREEMLGTEWPQSLPVPQAFVETVGRQNVAILDFRPQGRAPLTVEGETRLLRSVEETVLANGVDQIRYLLGGEATGVFLEHLAVPSAL